MNIWGGESLERRRNETKRRERERERENEFWPSMRARSHSFEARGILVRS